MADPVEIVCGNCEFHHVFSPDAAKKEKLCRNCVQPLTSRGQKRGVAKIGGLLAANKAIKRAASLTPQVLKFLDVVEEIRNAPDDADLAFMARQLVQCTLPHTDPGNVPAWQRENGNTALVLQPGWDKDAKCSIGYPYGTIPRLLLFWVITEIVRTKKRRIVLGRSLAQFMRDVGFDPNGGGKRSDFKRVRNQMRRLFRCHISFEATITEPGVHGHGWRNMEVAPDGEMWWDPKQPDRATLWESWVEKSSLRLHLPRPCRLIAAPSSRFVGRRWRSISMLG